MVGISLILIGFTISTFLFIAYPDYMYYVTGNLIISNSTATDICYNLSNNINSVPSSDNGKLICSIPSFDSTQNIIIKENSNG